jgi:tellurite resistance protein TerC
MWIWTLFFGVVLLLLILDLGILNKKSHEINMAESLRLSVLYIGVGCLFGIWVWWYKGPVAGMDYFTGFFVEKSLSMDNVFVISMIFSALQIPRFYQHRVLFWGILGAIMMRAIMIGIGATLITHFAWILYVFGAFLLFTGIKMLFNQEEYDFEKSRVLSFLRTRLRLTATLQDAHFLVKLPDSKNRLVWYATPLLLALVMIEAVDLVFAVDSIPAIFAITQDPFIVYTSNIFAILGLRALYFALAAMMHRFHYLKYALALVLIFIGIKISLTHLWPIPSLISLFITISTLTAGVLYSLYRTRVKM